MTGEMNEFLKRIAQMHSKFGIRATDVEFTDTEKEFRIECMNEEVDEYKHATTKEEELDSLVDLVVFALGTVERMGWMNVFEEAFNRVMDANMVKDLGPNQKRGHFALDLVKPAGWRAAEMGDLVIHRECSQTSLDVFVEQKKI